MSILQHAISVTIFQTVLGGYFILFWKGVFGAVKGRFSDGSFEQKIKSTALLLPLTMHTIEMVLAPVTLLFGAMEIFHLAVNHYRIDLWCVPFSVVFVVAVTGVLRVAKVKLYGITLVFMRMSATVVDLHIDTNPVICLVKFFKIHDLLVRLRIIKMTDKKEIIHGLFELTNFLARSIPELRRAGISTMVISSPWFLNEGISTRFADGLKSGVLNNQIQISLLTDTKLSFLTSRCAKQIFSEAFLKKEKLENAIIMPAKQMIITLI